MKCLCFCVHHLADALFSVSYHPAAEGGEILTEILGYAKHGISLGKRKLKQKVVMVPGLV